MKKFRKILLIIVVVLICTIFKSINIYATEDREKLREALEQQEENLQKDMEESKPISPENGKAFLDQTVNKTENTLKSNQEFSGEGLIVKIEKTIYSVVVKSRTISFIVYGLVWVLTLFYMATFGSKDVNGRRKAYLLLRNATVIFFVYINLPIILLWLGADKSNMTSLNTFNILFSILSFFQEHSLIIASLLAYAGFSRLIISKRNLPLKRQGVHLIKFAVILTVFLNVVPTIIYFLVD